MVYLKGFRKYKARALTSSSTDLLALPETGIVSALKLDFRVTGASGIGAANRARILDRLTKLEITDGGTKTMFSLTGQNLKALDFYSLGKLQPEDANLTASAAQRTSVTIPFGEYIGDPKKALDLAAWDQTQLEITNDGTATQWAAGALNVDVHLMTLEDLAAKPPSYYKHYQWKAEKPVAAAQYVNHALPTSDKIRRYWVQLDPDFDSAGTMTSDPAVDTNNLKFSFLEGKEMVIDARPYDIATMNAAQYGEVITCSKTVQSLSQYFDTGLMYNNQVKADPIFGTVATVSTLNLVVAPGTGRSAVDINIDTGTTPPLNQDNLCRGIGYYHTLMLYDALTDDENVFLNPSKTGGKGPVNLEVYNTQASHTVRSNLTVPMKQGEA
jgi:hypothetical protein